MEYVDYEVHKVEQNPSALLNTLDMVYPYAFFLELGDEVLANCADVRVGSPTRDNEIICHVRDAGQIEKHDVIRFHVQTEAGGAHCGRGRLAGGCRWGY